MQIVKEIYDAVVARDPEQPEFHQAVWEVLESLGPALERHPEYVDIVKRVVEPERLIHFRVPWVDDNGNDTLTVDSESNSTVQLVHTRVTSIPPIR